MCGCGFEHKVLYILFNSLAHQNLKHKNYFFKIALEERNYGITNEKPTTTNHYAEYILMNFSDSNLIVFVQKI